MHQVDKTDRLIAELARNAPPVKSVSPLTTFLGWSLATLAFVGETVTFAFGIRPDLASAMKTPHFLLVVISLLGLLASSAFAALFSSIPGRISPTWAVVLPFVFFSAFIAANLPPFNGASQLSTAALAGCRCSLALGALAALPLTAFFIFLRRLASTRPEITARAAALAALAPAALGLSFHCPSHEWPHLLLYHCLPMIILAYVVQKLAGRRLKW